MSLLRSLARHQWLFWIHAALLLLLSLVMLALYLLMRSPLLSIFISIFLLMVTGLFLVLSGLLDFGASVEAFLDKEAHAWLWIILAVAFIFAGIVIFFSPEISFERLLYFASVHALAIGFMETRLANRLRHHPAARARLLGFSRLSTAFVVLLLMGAVYGKSYSVLVLSTYCMIVAAELVFLPRTAHKPGHNSLSAAAERTKAE